MRDEGALASLSSQDGPGDGLIHDMTPREQGGTAAPRPAGEASVTRPDIIQTVIAQLGLAAADVATARLASRINQTDLGRELVSSGLTTEERLGASIAVALGLAAETVRAGDVIVGPIGPMAAAFTHPLRTCNAQLESKLYLAPRLETLGALQRYLADHPAIAQRTRIATPSAIARHRAAATAEERLRTACLGLDADRPALSARHVLTGAQGIIAGVLATVLVIAALLWMSTLLLLAHLVALPLFLAGSICRLAAARELMKPATQETDAGDIRPLPHPPYSVLVALREESELVPALVASLAAMTWPRSRLQVLLVCEADDPPTIAAVETAIAREPGFEIVLVPPAFPRTKPKALNMALPLATGDFVVLYDAEDRPDPGQLEEAWQGFRRGGERLACLQAPLVIGNGGRNWLTGHFALEYAALFRGFLPWLARKGLPLPLGGTSNHFRRPALVAVGAWDSHNVTEDADLGMRLAREGFRIGTINAPTFEDAPELLPVWLRQRSRWMKGWMQTWLLHMRNPRRLWRDLGGRGFIAFQLLFVSMVGSSIAHPLCVVFVTWTALSWLIFGFPGTLACVLITADLVSILLCIGSYALLAGTALGTSYARLARDMSTVVLYWLLVSAAALRAVALLVKAPHVWEKTPHGSASKSARDGR